MKSTSLGILIGVGLFSVAVYVFVFLENAGDEESVRSPKPSEIRIRIPSQEIAKESSDAPLDDQEIDAENSAEESDKKRQERIKEYQKIGYGHFLRQRDYLDAMEDPAERDEMSLLFTGSNQLMFAAVLQEMALDPTYVEELVLMLNHDGEFRISVIDILEQHAPQLVNHMKAGREIRSTDLETFFSERKGYMALFDESYRSKLPAKLGDDWDSAVSYALAADVLRWNEIRRGNLEVSEAPFLWGSAYDEVR